MSSGGWGGEPWGGGGWGGGAAPFALTLAVARRENVIRLEFDATVYWSNLGDLFDAARPSLFSVAPVAGTIGHDGQPARPVTPSNVYVPTDVDPALAGYFLDVVVDRTMSPYPAQYVVTASGLATDAAGTALLDPTQATLQLFGVAMQIVPPSDHLHERAGDFANPQTLLAAQRAGIANPQASQLGTYSPDGSGDYAVERGVDAWKARVVRMVLAKRGSFQHGPRDRGAGLGSSLKLRATGARLVQIQSAIEAEVLADPDTASAQVTALIQPSGLYRVTILAKLRNGQIVKFGTDAAG